MDRIKMHFPKVKLPFYPPCEVKCKLQNGVSTPLQTSPHQAESANVHQQDEFLNLERERDRQNYQEGSVHIIHTDGSSFRRKSHISHKRDNDKAMQREIDDLKKQLRRAQ